MNEKTFTGYKRKHKTRRGVVIAEHMSRGIITVGGIGVIAAVFLVFVFLASVVVPLAKPASIETLKPDLPVIGNGPQPAFMDFDEFLTAGFIGFDSGQFIRHFRVDTGEILGDFPLYPEAPTALSYTHTDGWIVAGFSDGAVRLGRLRFETDFLENEDADPRYHGLKEGERDIMDGNVVERTPVGQLRVQKLTITGDDALPPVIEEPVLLIDKTIRASGPIIAALTADGTLSVNTVSRRTNILTGQVTTTLSGGTIRVPGFLREAAPDYLFISSFADTVYLLWKDGGYMRFDVRDLRNPHLAEEGRLISEKNVYITKAAMLIGRGTILVGDSAGNVSAWFRARKEDAGSSDGLVLVNAHTFAGSAPVSSIATSARRRLIAVGYADGAVRSFYVTSGRSMGNTEALSEGPASVVTISPKDDAIGVAGNVSAAVFTLNAAYPEASGRAIFGKIWYEGNSEPAHIWQSSSGTDTFEAKYGLGPLIFGTLKATFYSLLFGIPIAILAAIYTSEFLQSRLRSRIKPVIEMMASLPSVVLGFLAALVFAPFVEKVVPTVLAAFVMIPLTFVLGGYLFQLLPRKTAIIFSRHGFSLLLFAALPAGIILAMIMGPFAERVLFSGDLKAWLDGRIGDGSAGWLIMLLPMAAFATILLMNARVTPYIRGRYPDMENAAAARMELLKFAGGALFTLLVAGAAAKALTLAGLDSRDPFPFIGPVLGTYVQRNSLIVGFIMGFAIIPIIYTISDDAFASVPDHLRSASLASGATTWQTAIRVIIPTAMSGLFSATMIGLGRAVGETMIVLMAAGNTPILEWNIFNGFRTLAANIAVELPEAVVGSTHYRILFLAALTLFVITFIVNTVAEIIRQRFRKRAFEL